MADPNPSFTNALLSAYRRAHAAGYNASYFLPMLQERHGYETAIHLIHSPQASLGFTRLYELGLLNLTVESIVLLPEWNQLFPEETLRAAYDRLTEFGYTVPKTSWCPGVAAPPLPPPASDLADVPADRAETVIYRIIRDTTLARRVKAMHGFECQICGLSIELPGGSRYAEAHHIQPLGKPHDGPDVLENILCVCPNHHAELDYGVLKLRLDLIRQREVHAPAAQYVDYHNLVIHGKPPGSV